MSDQPTPIACKRAEERDQAAISGGKMACLPCAVAGAAALFVAEVVAWFFAGLIEIVSRFGAFF